MEVSNAWVGKIVKLDLVSGYYYKGKIISVSGDSLTLRDVNGNLVTLLISQITLIREVISNGS